MSQIPKLQNFINGEFVDPIGDEWIDDYCPHTGEIHYLCPRSKEEDANAAIAAAVAAKHAWAAKTNQERAAILYKIADLVESRIEEFALAESTDQGKTFLTAKNVDINRVAYNFRFFAGHILHMEEMSTEASTGALNFVLRTPVGVVGLISPWNLPLYLLTWKIAPAIAFGNTVVCKPSELTPVTAALFGTVLKDAGVPNGVVNILFGYGHEVGNAIVSHPDVPAISFTGGTVTGRRISQVAAPMLKKLSLELGGKNAAVVFEDANLAEAVPTLVRAAFSNQGEICLCCSRILVQRSIYDKFVTEYIEAAKKFKAGPPLESTSSMGALISADHLKKVLSYIELAKSEGGQVLLGGETPEGLPEEFKNGYWLSPTVIAGLPNTSRVNQEEIFGPVTCLIPFDTEEDGVRMANGVQYGLCISVWTQNNRACLRLARAFETGTVWVNSWMVRDLRVPFGGVKQSGVGREGGKFSADFYTEVKTVCIQ